MDIIGSIPNIEVGQSFTDRQELHNRNIHRGLMRGIAPRGLSIVMSGGYIDDEDQGDLVIYTGEGGRDSNTGRQIADQEFKGGNLHLANNCDNGIPIRVSRGGKLKSDYAPDSKGYRYDGLYRVDDYWREQGRDGFQICRFRLIRLDDQSNISEYTEKKPSRPFTGGNRNPERTKVTVSRVIRSTAVGNEVKRIYDYKCQACGIRLETMLGPYAECCHIKPLGKPHEGPDELENVLCLCPNCHVLFDKHALLIGDDFQIIGTKKTLTVNQQLHSINKEYLAYHRSLSSKS